MGFGGLLNQLSTTTAGGGMGAVVENYPVASGYSINAGDVVDVNEDGEVVSDKKPLSELPEGTIIQLNENGSPVDFYIAKHNYESELNGAGRTLIVRKNIYNQRQWHSSNVNAWANCSMRSWLNSTYKSLLDADIQELIGSTNYRYTPGNGNNTVTTRSDSVFLLSMTELGRSATYANTEGTMLPTASTLRVAYSSSGIATIYWVRSPFTGGTNSVYCIYADGTPSAVGCSENHGSRPAFTLPSSFSIRDNSLPNPTQAIALQSGTAGQTIPVCYSGIVKAPFVSQGDVISSSGVTGVGILDGVLQVYAKDAPEKVVTGSYVGNGTYGQSNPNTLTFSKTPKMFGIYAVENPSGADIFLDATMIEENMYPWLSGQTLDLILSQSKRTKMTFTDNTVSWYCYDSNPNAMAQLNVSGYTYYYFVAY